MITFFLECTEMAKKLLIKNAHENENIDKTYKCPCPGNWISKKFIQEGTLTFVCSDDVFVFASCSFYSHKLNFCDWAV